MLPLSYLNQLTYCPRRFWYMYVQGEIAINAPMLEGTYQHQTRADKPGQDTDDNGRIIHRRLWVWSDRLQIAGFADFVETTKNEERSAEDNFIIHNSSLIIPVEYKHGRKAKWHNDQIQLCAQALCLEEMTGQSIGQGEIFYWRSRRRITVPFDETLRQLTETAVSHAHQLSQNNSIPAPISERQKCKHCSIQPICLPDEVEQLRMRNLEL
ncbi:CRISPR-associated RecB family exonuclease Cas4 [hydrothermal vent metagenome]|uniref:CRISPR-associated exonuclease Cas4 n=1 Tax=hydrothermal vent metagenome TaxID=652676 RepID=A0A3B0VBI8_9ZZZZ